MKIPVVRNATFAALQQVSAINGDDDVTCRRAGVTSSGVTSSRTECRRTTSDAAVSSGWMLERQATKSHRAFFYTECVCNAWFSLELCIRFIVAPSRLDFIGTLASRTPRCDFGLCGKHAGCAVASERITSSRGCPATTFAADPSRLDFIRTFANADV